MERSDRNNAERIQHLKHQVLGQFVCRRRRGDTAAAHVKNYRRRPAGELSNTHAVLAKAVAERIDALFLTDDSHTAGDPEVRRRVLAFAAKERLPISLLTPGLRPRRRPHRYGAIHPGDCGRSGRLCGQDSERNDATRCRSSCRRCIR